MSHTVVRGKPTASQLYLDEVLNELLLERNIKPDARQRSNVTLTQLMFFCLKQRPDSIFMINGATGEKMTNGQLLKRSVSLARALVTAGARGKRVMLLMRNHQHMIVVYFAVLFAGVLPFCMDPSTTAFELAHFLKLVEPSYVFYDREHHSVLHEALDNTHLKTTLFIVDEPQHLMEFAGAFSDDVESFQLPDSSPEDTLMMLPTSGSTGLPKAAELTQRGTMISIPVLWAYHTKFPTPTRLVMVLTSLQWMTFTMTITSCVANDIPVLISPIVNTVQSVTHLLEKYRPTWTFLAPAFASALIASIRPDQLTSLETLIFLGAPSTPELMQSFKDKLSDKTHLCNGYGTTETQGFIAIPDKETPVNCSGRVINALYYKIIDEFGQELGPNQTGELCVKGDCLIKTYHKSDKLKESLTEDGWYKTGDAFHLDENERISFAIRKKFSFKFNGCHVSPEEVERMVESVEGVCESAVCASDKGPAAAVVMQPQARVTREQIHAAVNAALSDHKRLHGGVVFVPFLPHTHSGKLNRTECTKLILHAIDTGECY